MFWLFLLLGGVMARDWIDPAQAAIMLHHMDLGWFRKHYCNPETRTCHELVVQQFHGPKGRPRYKVLAISVVQFLQNHTIIERDGRTGTDRD